MNGLDSKDLFDFGILLQALASNMKVGILAVRDETRVKYLQLDRTRLAAMFTGKPKVSLGKVLYNHRAIEKAPLREAVEHVERTQGGEGLGEYLVAQGLVTPEQLRRANHYQMLEEMLELFYWKNVGFKFTSAGTRETLPGGPHAQVGEPMEVDSLLIQCTKTIDDIAKFDEVTPSLRDVYELHVDSLDTLYRLVPDPTQREFVLLIDGVRDMREVLRDMRANRFEVLEFFYRFRKRGLIRPKNAFELLMLAENRRREFTLEKRARVYERVNELGVEGFEVVIPLAETYEEMGQGTKAAALFAKHARGSLAAGDPAAALSAVQRATTLAPDDSTLREFEIEVLLATDRPAEAGASYRVLATLREKTGDAAGARAALKRAAKLHPADPTNWQRLADLLAAAGRPRRAAARLRRAGDVLCSNGRAALGVEAYRRALALAPGAWTLRYRLIERLHDLGQDDVAIQEIAELVRYLLLDTVKLTKAARLRHLVRAEQSLARTGGLLSSAATQLGRAYAQLGDTARALDALRATAEALAAARRHRGVVEALDAFIELAPNDVEARKGLARAHLALGDTNRSVAQLRRAGGILTAARSWAAARDVYDEMLRVDPGCADAHTGLANAQLELGEERNASVHFHRAALLHRGYGKIDQAIAFFREAVAKNPGDADLLHEYCEVLMATDRRDDKLQALSALVELRMSLNEPARAAIALTQILAIDPRYPGAKSILQEAARRLSCLAEVSEEIPAAEARAIIDRIRAEESSGLRATSSG